MNGVVLYVFVCARVYAALCAWMVMRVGALWGRFSHMQYINKRDMSGEGVEDCFSGCI